MFIRNSAGQQVGDCAAGMKIVLHIQDCILALVALREGYEDRNTTRCITERVHLPSQCEIGIRRQCRPAGRHSSSRFSLLRLCS